MFDHIYYCEPDEFLNRMEHLTDRSIAVFISTSAAKRFGFDVFLRRKTQAGWVWVENIAPNPTPDAVFEALSLLRKKRPDMLVAVGGGSTIDLAKMASALLPLDGLSSPQQLLEAVQAKQYLKTNGYCSIIAVPTTAGTGSEVTAWATLWDHEQSKKYSIEAPGLVPEEVWCVPDFLRTLPARTILSTGLDAIAQASEAYWARRSNPLAQALSIRALQMMLRYLPLVLRGETDSATLTGLATGSLTAGLAFGKTRTTACHSISYPLTSLFQIEHGFAAAMTLAPIAAINARAVDCSELFDTFGGDIAARLDALCHGIQPLRLTSFGIEKTHIPLIAKNAFTAGRMDNNPVDFSDVDVESILYSVLDF